MSKRTAQTIARRVRQIRLDLGYTQQAVADRLGVARPRISEIEHGKRKVSSVELVRLATLFSVPMGEFFEPKPTPRYRDTLRIPDAVLASAERERLHA